jgi:hypothetical protein
MCFKDFSGIPMLKHSLRGKSVYLLELNWFNLLFVLVFRLAGIHVYYLTTSPFWQKENKINRLNDLGIIWLNYQDVLIKEKSAAVIPAKANELMEYTSLFLIQTNIFHHLKKQIGLSDYEEQSLSSVIVRSLESRIRMLAELLVFAELIESKNTKKGWLCIPNDVHSRNILEKEGGWTNICPRWCTFLSFSVYGLSRIVGMILGRLMSLSYSMIHKMSHIGEKQNIPDDISINNNWSKYEIIYFPHKGIWYGEHFLKDHFYSSDPGNPFYSSKILHLSLSEDSKTIKNSLRYYKENNIPYTDWGDIPSVTKKKMILMLFLFAKKHLTTAWKEFDLYLFVVLLYNYIKITINIKRLEQIQKLKIVLIGYDVLCPPQLTLACKMKKISTVAVQERMLSAWTASPFSMDHYFVYGRAANQILEERCKGLINKKYDIGPIRLSKHYEAAETKKLLRKLLPDYKYRVLALDVHSVPGFYKNGRCAGNYWRYNIKFYQDILKLCAAFSQVYFMIKGKNYDFINIPYFFDVADKIEQTPNCMLIKDYYQWTPFTSVAVSDIAIAVHTSLGDEMLALGKPVIFYDRLGFPSQVFDYGSEIQAYTFEDLKLKLASFFENQDKYNQRLDPIRRKCYSVSNVTPKQKLDQCLIEIYNATKKNDR